MKNLIVLLVIVALAAATPVTRQRASIQGRHGNLLQELEDVGCFTMVDLMIEAGFTGLLTGEEVYTIFSPEDTAFDQALIDTLLADADLLTRFLNYHMTSGNVTLALFENDATLTTLEGTTVRTNIYDSTYTVNGAAVTMPDEWADNGMVQVINKVLFPIPVGAIPTVLADDSEGRFTTLSMCIELSGLSGVLTGGPFTLFAPTNAAFDALPEGVLDALLSQPEGALKKVLLGHVAPTTIFATGVTSGEVPSASDDNLVLNVGPDGVTVDAANVIETDLVATNGVVHVIDAVI
ncbi:transforming growth factor-beta-induced protein ig-h3-like isoform X1 [Artemia franciscana]